RACGGVCPRPGSPPSRLASPPSLRSRPSRMRMVVVLPAPFGPRKACTSPVPTSRSSPSSATTRPYRLVSPAARSASLPIPPLYAAGPASGLLPLAVQPVENHVEAELELRLVVAPAQRGGRVVVGPLVHHAHQMRDLAGQARQRGGLVLGTHVP